jgi:glycosyltransferase involved in cell wall biosynthesis
MRIVYVNPAAGLGGAELILLDILATLPQALPGVEQHLILTAEGPLVDRARALGVEVHMRPMPSSLASLGDSALRGRGKAAAALALAARGFPASLSTLKYARELRSVLRSLEPSVIHSNGIKSHLLLRLATPRGVPVAWHIHDFWGSRPLAAKALRWAARRARLGLAITRAVADDAKLALGSLPIEVVYNGIDVDHFRPGEGNGAQLDALAGLKVAEPGVARVGLVATYARWKGQNLLLDAAAMLLAGPSPLKARFYIIGGPIYQTKGSQFDPAELQARVRDCGLSSDVGFIPFQSDPADVYRSLDVVVHASTQPEPFGRTIAEGMACGRPVIVSKAGGAVELFTEGVDAVGFPPGDAAALAHTIGRLVGDPKLRRSIGDAARSTAAERFSRQRMGSEVARHLGRLAATGPSSSGRSPGRCDRIEETGPNPHSG